MNQETRIIGEILSKPRSLKEIVKSYRIVQFLLLTHRGIKVKFPLFRMIGFFADIRKFKSLETNNNFSIEHLKPMVYDKTDSTPVDPVYFYQDSWCAKKIFENKPKSHVDIGSNVEFIGIISQFVPTATVDIREVDLNQEGLRFVKGSILKLPYFDEAIDSLSSICVIEHIGLGRYGDPLDQFGSEKSAKELKRILAPNGNLYISVPVDDENKIYFNAHRAFTRDYMLKMFSPLELVEEKYIYGRSLFDNYSPKKGFGTGMYHFTKLSTS